MSDIAFGLFVVVFAVCNAASFILGYIQRGMELRNAEKNLERWQHRFNL